MHSISCTTRSRRATDASGQCYDCVSEAQFDAMVARHAARRAQMLKSLDLAAGTPPAVKRAPAPAQSSPATPE